MSQQWPEIAKNFSQPREPGHGAECIGPVYPPTETWKWQDCGRGAQPPSRGAEALKELPQNSLAAF